MPDTDIAIIGAGAAGLSVAAIAASLGFRTTLIERGAMGGDCLNTGCVPSKALLAVAHLAAEARRAPRYGVVVPPPEIDWALVQAHVRSAIAKIAPHDSEERFRAMGVEVLRATGRFTGRDSLDVGGRRLVFRRAVIAAGSHAVLPPIPGLGLVPFLTHETIFDLLTCPQHLLVLGGGPIGLEMALAHRRLGARVTLVEQAQIASREDPECVDVLRAALAAEGVELREGLGVAELAPAPGGLLARLTMAPLSRPAICWWRRAVRRGLMGWGWKRPGLWVRRAGLQQIGRCERGAIGASGWRGILLTLKGLARVPLPMWRLSMPGSSPGPCCFACLQSWITRRCRA